MVVLPIFTCLQQKYFLASNLGSSANSGPVGSLRFFTNEELEKIKIRKNKSATGSVERCATHIRLLFMGLHPQTARHKTKVLTAAFYYHFRTSIFKTNHQSTEKLL